MNGRHSQKVMGELHRELIKEIRQITVNSTATNVVYSTALILSSQATLATNTAS